MTEHVLERPHPLAGTEVHELSWGELGEDLKSKLEAQASSGDTTAAKNAEDLLVLLHIALGNRDEVAPGQVKIAPKKDT